MRERERERERGREGENRERGALDLSVSSKGHALTFGSRDNRMLYAQPHTMSHRR